ncbi:MAG TPA: hypothetical protein VFP47_09675 [Pyrinomonadaceae bacterium]|nr:hypothetical protein [Pyrinomonadaceae bacterium]
MRLRHTAFFTLLVCLTVFMFIRPTQTANSPLIISEFRLRGPNGTHDEFIEIYNNTDEAHVVTAAGMMVPFGITKRTNPSDAATA